MFAYRTNKFADDDKLETTDTLKNIFVITLYHIYIVYKNSSNDDQ